MDQRHATSLVGDCRGFITFNKLLLVLILFGGYSACKFAPVHFSKSNVEHAIETSFVGANHLITDDAIRAKVARGASAAASLELEPEHVAVSRESRDGERVIYVDISYPVTVSYLGSERVVMSEVHYTKVFKVSEARETRRIAQEQREADRQAQLQDVINRRYGENLQSAWTECEARFGRGGCEVTHGPAPAGHDPTQIQKGWK
jgi:hypothetical protein